MPAATSAAETANSVKTLQELLGALSISKSPEDAKGHAQNVARFLNSPEEACEVPLT